MKRNVLFIIADEFRADCLSAVGHPVVRTPNIDALAREGTLFTKCFVQTAPCGPSRMSIYTGRYLCSHQSSDNMTPLAEAEDNLAMHLRKHGMDPAIMGYNDYALDPRILPDGHPHKTSLNYDYFLPGFDVILDHEYDSKDGTPIFGGKVIRRSGAAERSCTSPPCRRKVRASTWNATIRHVTAQRTVNRSL